MADAVKSVARSWQIDPLESWSLYSVAILYRNEARPLGTYLHLCLIRVSGVDPLTLDEIFARAEQDAADNWPDGVDGKEHYEWHLRRYTAFTSQPKLAG